MTTEHSAPLSTQNLLALAVSLELPLEPERAALIAGVLHHVRTVIARLDDLSIETPCVPAFAFDAAGGSTLC